MNNVFLRIHGILIHLVIQQEGFHQNSILWQESGPLHFAKRLYDSVFFYLLCHLCTVNAKGKFVHKSDWKESDDVEMKKYWTDHSNWRVLI